MMRIEVTAYRRETSVTYRKKLDRIGKGLHANSTLKIIKLLISQINLLRFMTDVSMFSKNWQDVTDRSSGNRSKWLCKNLVYSRQFQITSRGNVLLKMFDGLGISLR